MKGIVLAGGSGTRLYPLTRATSKQLLPVYDKPMIYYPISVLMLAGIREILIISTPQDIFRYKELLGDGKNLGVKFSFKVQDKPNGLAEAFILGEKFIGKDNVCLILGDNIFYGSGFQKILASTKTEVDKNNTSFVFGKYVDNPSEFGIAEIDKYQKIISLEEKPIKPKSNYAILGLYFYPNEVIEIAKKIKPSKRGELEITSINSEFLKIDKIKINILSRGFAWMDTGNHQSLHNASKFVQNIESNTGLKIACLEEIAFKMNFIDKKTIINSIFKLKGPYYDYIRKILN
ncbi:MAG: glucose-1-phosphate thymidylyltransferase [Rickettsiales bacterium TMED289]|nr:MAG: glucose-1-phosphate thymidylyltransferase [Rickettsiales bacterium TMED289]|tara:strand:+ start:4411 stop:5280 length:870 start_codon:yes stop_codon:yes gene_type:complete